MLFNSPSLGVLVGAPFAADFVLLLLEDFNLGFVLCLFIECPLSRIDTFISYVLLCGNLLYVTLRTRLYTV